MAETFKIICQVLLLGQIENGCFALADAGILWLDLKFAAKLEIVRGPPRSDSRAKDEDNDGSRGFRCQTERSWRKGRRSSTLQGVNMAVAVAVEGKRKTAAGENGSSNPTPRRSSSPLRSRSVVVVASDRFFTIGDESVARPMRRFKHAAAANTLELPTERKIVQRRS